MSEFGPIISSWLQAVWIKMESSPVSTLSSVDRANTARSIDSIVSDKDNTAMTTEDPVKVVESTENNGNTDVSHIYNPNPILSEEDCTANSGDIYTINMDSNGHNRDHRNSEDCAQNIWEPATTNCDSTANRSECTVNNKEYVPNPRDITTDATDWAAADSTDFATEPKDFAGGKPFYCLFGDTSDTYNTEMYLCNGERLGEDGLPNYRCTITRSRTWVWPKFSGFTTWSQHHNTHTLHSVEGHFLRSGHLHGRGRLTYCDGVIMVATFYHGVPRGLTVGLYREQVIWVAKLDYDGYEVGQCCARDWEAGGLLLGEPVHGELTGYCTYIYPDLGTALVGTFKKGLMTAAQAATVTSLSIVDDIPYTKCSPCYGPVFSYSPPTKSSFGPSDPLLRDPFEKKLVEVRQSSISGGGEGVFALTQLEPNTVAAIFNGFRVPIYGSMLGHMEEEGEDMYDRLAYNIHMPEEEDFFLDIPPKQADLSVYCGSVGHKVNHSFLPNCVFGTMHHPRWGRVRTVTTLNRVTQGEELFTDYGYDLFRCPDWFRDVWTKELGHKYHNWWDYRRE